MNPERAASQQAPRWLTAAGVAGLAAGALAAALRRLGDFDLPWHLATGRAILDPARSARVDDFSYTFRGAPLRLEWLSESILWLAFRAAGPLGLHLLAALVIGALAALLAWRGAPPRILQRSNRPLSLALAAAALALIASGSWLVVRPALLSFTLFAGALALVDHHRRGGRLRALAALVPLQLAWAQMHGFAPLGAMVAVGYALHVALCRVARGRAGALLPRAGGRDAAGVALVAALALAASAAGTYGLDAFTAALRFRGYEGYITEWTPTTLDFLARHDPAVLVLAFAALLAVAAGRETDDDGGARAPALYDLGLLVATALFAARSVRLIPLFAIAAAPLAARRLLPALAGARSLPWLGAACGLACAPALLVAPGTRPGLGFDDRNLPVAATDWIAANRPAGPLFNFMPFGGWLALRLYPAPDARVFIDGRTGWLYPRDFLDAYHRASYDTDAFAALQQKWRFEWALVRSAPSERFAVPLAADRAWVLVFLDDSGAVYVRRGGSDHNRALADAGYHRLRHLTPLAFVLADPDPFLDDHDAALAAAQAPDSPRAWLFVAARALARGDAAAARTARDRIAALAPDYPGLPLLEGRLAALR